MNIKSLYKATNIAKKTKDKTYFLFFIRENQVLYKVINS